MKSVLQNTLETIAWTCGVQTAIKRSGIQIFFFSSPPPLFPSPSPPPATSHFFLDVRMYVKCPSCKHNHYTSRKCSNDKCKGKLRDTIVNFGDMVTIPSSPSSLPISSLTLVSIRSRSLSVSLSPVHSHLCVRTPVFIAHPAPRPSNDLLFFFSSFVCSFMNEFVAVCPKRRKRQNDQI